MVHNERSPEELREKRETWGLAGSTSKKKRKKPKVMDNFQSFGASKEEGGPVSGVLNRSDSEYDTDEDNDTVMEEDEEVNFRLVNHDEVKKVLERFYNL